MQVNNIYTLKISYKKRWLNISLLILVLFVLIFGKNNYPKLSSFFIQYPVLQYGIVVMSCMLMFYELMRLFFGSVIIDIDTMNMKVTHSLLGITSSKDYNLLDIKNIRLDFNVLGDYWWAQGGNLDKDPVRLYFEYKNEVKMIGAGLESFPADVLKLQIEMRQKK